MKIIQKSSLKQPLLSVFVPTKLELFALITSSLAILVLLNMMSAVKKVNAGDYVQVSEYIKSYVQKFLEPTESRFGATIFTFLFWMVIGILSYMFVWVIVTIYISYKNDRPWDGHMILPKDFSKSRAGHEVLTRFLIRTLALLSLLFWLYLFFVKLLPSASNMFLESVGEFNLESVFKFFFSILSLAGSMFVVSILARFVMLRTRVF